MDKISGDFLIEINGVQKVDGERDEINVITEGDYFKRGNERFVSYTEYDTENPDVFHNSMIRFKPGDDIVTIMRTGENRSRLTLERDKRHLCHYSTPFGAIMIGVYTDTVSYNLNDDGGELFVSYTLDFNAGLMSSNEFTLKIRRKDA